MATSSFIDDRFVDNQGLRYDLDFIGELAENGSLPEQYGEPALANAFKLWLISHKGETFRQPLRGGFLAQYLNKPMQDSTIDGIKHSIKDGVDADWNGSVQVVYMEVTPNYEQKTWYIELQVYSPVFKIFEDLELTVQNVG